MTDTPIDHDTDVCDYRWPSEVGDGTRYGHRCTVHGPHMMHRCIGCKATQLATTYRATTTSKGVVVATDLRENPNNSLERGVYIGLIAPSGDLAEWFISREEARILRQHFLDMSAAGLL